MLRPTKIFQTFSRNLYIITSGASVRLWYISVKFRTNAASLNETHR